ncbi:MAG: DNA-protecting protein DprA [Spirochaetaceae bacterium]|nr:DNA-protecting protein DprA [Spirochaetaceae bacterium]
MNQIDIKSTEYPYLLKQIKDPPETLYYRGEWNPEIFKQTLSVVGSRKMTRYGEAITKEIVTDTASAGITIVSGFMYGIDAQAHEGALNASGHTIAVMPCGIDRIHPEYQMELYKKIEKDKGLILSEYPGETPPALWTYPRRNRIIAGLSPVLLVIEAGLKSGALITARIAQKYNKKIFAVPGPLTSSVSEGTSLLIKEGASIFTKSDDLLSEFGIGITGKTKNKKQASNLNPSQRKIMELLSRQPMGIDEIIRILNKPTSKVGADLTFLSLKKMISLHDGKYSISRNRSAGNRIC